MQPRALGTRTPDERRACGDLRLAVPRLAGRLLPPRTAPAARARVRRRAADVRGDQRLVLLAAATGVLPPVAQRGTRGLRVRGQGRPVHHPPQAAPRRRDTAGQLLRVRRARARPCPGPGAVAAARAPDLRRRTCSTRSSASCPGPPARQRRWPARHDDKVPEDRAVTTTERDRPVRHALEFRSPTFADEAAYELLRRHGVACVVADTAGRWPKVLEVTSDLVYVRLHGDRELYASGYSPRALDEWAERCRAWADDGPRRLRLLRQRREGTRPARRGRPARAVVVTVSPPRAGCRPSWRSTSPGGS